MNTYLKSTNHHPFLNYSMTIAMLLIGSIFTMNTVNAQTIDTTIQKIIDHKLIDNTQIAEFEELLKQGKSKTNSTYIYSLFQIELKKITRQLNLPFGNQVEFSGKLIDPNEQIKLNKKLHEYLLKLNKTDLLDEKQFKYFQVKIESNEFVSLAHLLQTIFVQLSSNEYMHPEKLKLFADKLKNNGIVSLNYDKLINDIEQEQLQNPIDFLNYCNYAILIIEEDFAHEPDKYLELIYKKTASIMPELGFANFKFQVILDSTVSNDETKLFKVVVSLESNGKTYIQESFYRLYNPNKNQYDNIKIDQQEYYKLFNKILSDLQSPFRLHEVKVYQGNILDLKMFGIIALTKEQAEFLHGNGVGEYFTPSFESFRTK